ncbi:YecA family protein [Lysobacter silvisoli]|uniref:YecA family protein n=1 Tax=Lysobacter silvisoli TaxID=2293254 RepID=A0A371K6Z8_9GAMM|nr:YecA family protein [Lysobacter silvisoli]
MPVSAIELPALSAVDAQSRQLALAATPSELHGALCGWLAGGGASVRDWPGKVLADNDLGTPDNGSPLDQLRLASAAQLSDRSFEFSLLLPDADASLAERSGALFDWCRGFLSAFGLAGASANALSVEGREALGDLAKLAAAQPQDDGDEEDEEALAEIEEFVRVAALLLHGDIVLAAQHRQRLN